MATVSNLTPRIEELFFDVYTLLDAKAKGEDIGALTIWDAVKDLEVEVEETLGKLEPKPSLLGFIRRALL